jgi:non-lysosomal glucosylceramidase
MPNTQLPYPREELYRQGPQRSFSGRALGEVAFPLGGIGTGTVSLGGRGQLRDWEIFNRPGKGVTLPYTFFAIWAQAQGGSPIARVLESRLQPPYTRADGLASTEQAGLPRLDSCIFHGEYPFARIAFADKRLPLQVELEAFNPMAPLDADLSGLPVAIFIWRLRNPGPAPVDATLAFSLANVCGYDGMATLDRNASTQMLGRCLNRWMQGDGIHGMAMTTEKYAPNHPNFGSLAIATSWVDLTYTLRWKRAGWFDAFQSFWDDFADGRLRDDPTPDRSPDGRIDYGTLGLRVQLAPGENAELPIVLAWHMPNLTNTWNAGWRGLEGLVGKPLGNYYTLRFKDAWDAATYTIRELPTMEATTRRFHDTLFESTLPAHILDAVSSQMSIIRTTTCLRTSDAKFHGFEGCNDNVGCCPMNCTHVWNYEQALAYLYPALERTMRDTDFAINTRDDGDMAFRTALPLTPTVLWDFKPAADGQMGSVMKVYREWLLYGDTAWLRRLWPEVKRALEYAWRGQGGNVNAAWDPDGDGVMEGEQHNTYDIEFYGPNTMCGSLYLGALRAAAELAQALGENATADEYRSRYERGRTRLDQELWNGEYYIQREPPVDQIVEVDHGSQPWHASAYVPGETELRYQYGRGCLSDQLLGAWFGAVVGLGDLLPPERVRATLQSIFRYNWRADLSEHANTQRTYALNDEAGLLLCSWPLGERPTQPFPYSDEVWTGIEYQVAAHLIYVGLLDEGLTIVHGLRDRYDGERRNPWNEFECGNHYARAMASWSLVLALSGYHYSAPANQIGFAPAVNAQGFRCFFSAGSGWGSFAQESADGTFVASLELRAGSLRLERIALRPPAPPTQAGVALNGATLAAHLEQAGTSMVVVLDEPVMLSEGEMLEVQLMC